MNTSPTVSVNQNIIIFLKVVFMAELLYWSTFDFTDTLKNHALQ